MKKIDASILHNLENPIIKYKLKIYFKQVEEYTENDYLIIPFADMITSLSDEGSYQIANTTVLLNNTTGYFSEKFDKELPVNKKADIQISINNSDYIDVFSGIINVGGWKLNDTQVSLQINA